MPVDYDMEALFGEHGTTLLVAALLPIFGRCVLDFLVPSVRDKSGCSSSTASSQQEPVPAKTAGAKEAPYAVGERLWTKHPDCPWWERLTVRRLAEDGTPWFDELSESREASFRVERPHTLPVRVGQSVWVGKLIGDPWLEARVAPRGRGGELHVYLLCNQHEADRGLTRLGRYDMVCAAVEAPPRPYTMEIACYGTAEGGRGWSAMLALTQQSQCGALARATVRFLFWHVAQPVAYFVVLAVRASLLDNVQLILGIGVAVREAVYLLATLACVVTRPTFLVIDVAATVRQRSTATNYYGRGWPFLSLYVASPDKVVVSVLAYAAIDTKKHSWAGHIPLVFGVFSGIFDLCGVAALSAGFASGVMPLELAVGYAATALSALCLCISFVAGHYEHLREGLAKPELSAAEKFYGVCFFLLLTLNVLALPVLVAGWPVLAVLTSGSTAAIIELGVLAAMGASTAFTFGSSSSSLDKCFGLAFAICTVLVLVLLSVLIMIRNGSGGGEGEEDQEEPLSWSVYIPPLLACLGLLAAAMANCSSCRCRHGRQRSLQGVQARAAVPSANCP